MAKSSAPATETTMMMMMMMMTIIINGLLKSKRFSVEKQWGQGLGWRGWGWGTP